VPKGAWPGMKLPASLRKLKKNPDKNTIHQLEMSEQRRAFAGFSLLLQKNLATIDFRAVTSDEINE
jgi:hypothetical protein